MKLRRVSVHQRKRQVELVTRSGRTLSLPFVRLEPRPTTRDPVAEIYVDPELAHEAATFRLRSGREGVVHVDQALDYNRDPSYMGSLVLHQLTVEARDRVENSGLSRRELARRLGTSVPQVYRLLDPSRANRNLAQLLALLQVLDCDVKLTVIPRRRSDPAPAARRRHRAA